ncbi:MAG: hypothetical protein R2685_02560 [Candidatus Nitrosocosmicus sp.]|nr:hypothetical protein [Candidatus Nitrosocosmicus sp.]
MEKSDNWIDDRLLVGHGSIHLTVIDQKGNILKNGNFAVGDTNKHYPFTAWSDNLIAISWIDGTSVKLASIPII